MFWEIVNKECQKEKRFLVQIKILLQINKDSRGIKGVVIELYYECIVKFLNIKKESCKNGNDSR